MTNVKNRKIIFIPKFNFKAELVIFQVKGNVFFYIFTFSIIIKKALCRKKLISRNAMI